MRAGIWCKDMVRILRKFFYAKPLHWIFENVSAAMRTSAYFCSQKYYDNKIYKCQDYYTGASSQEQ